MSPGRDVGRDSFADAAHSVQGGLGGFVAGLASVVKAQAAGYALTATHSYTLIFAWASGGPVNEFIHSQGQKILPQRTTFSSQVKCLRSF